MKCRSAIILAATCIFLAAALAQGPPMPTPAPELKKLDYFVGTWSFEGDTKPGPMGPGGKFTGTDHNEWMEGNFFLITHTESNSSMGKVKGLGTWGYNSDEKVYTFQEYNSMGETFLAKGTVNGDSWRWLTDDKMGKGRYSMKILSPTSYNIKLEVAPPGSSEFVTVMEGKATKK